MGFGVVTHLIAHTRFENESATIPELGVQLAFHAKKHMTFLTPVIGQVTGRVFDHSHADAPEVAGSPISDARFAAMLCSLDLGPVDSFKRKARHFHVMIPDVGTKQPR